MNLSNIFSLINELDNESLLQIECHVQKRLNQIDFINYIQSESVTDLSLTCIECIKESLTYTHKKELKLTNCDEEEIESSLSLIFNQISFEISCFTNTLISEEECEKMTIKCSVDQKNDGQVPEQSTLFSFKRYPLSDEPPIINCHIKSAIPIFTACKLLPTEIANIISHSVELASNNLFRIGGDISVIKSFKKLLTRAKDIHLRSQMHEENIDNLINSGDDSEPAAERETYFEDISEESESAGSLDDFIESDPDSDYSAVSESPSPKKRKRKKHEHESPKKSKKKHKKEHKIDKKKKQKKKIKA